MEYIETIVISALKYLSFEGPKKKYLMNIIWFVYGHYRATDCLNLVLRHGLCVLSHYEWNTRIPNSNSVSTVNLLMLTFFATALS